MPLRRRLTLSAAAAVGVAVLIAACVCLLVVRRELRGQVDDQVRTLAAGLAQRLPPETPPLPAGVRQTGPLGAVSLRQGGLGPYIAVEGADGRRLTRGLGQDIDVLIDATDRAVPRGQVELRDRHVGGLHLRTASARGRVGVVVVARPVDGIDRVLSRLGVTLALVALGGIALAVLLGRLVGRGVLAPLAEVAEAAQHIGDTDDLGRRLVVRSDDEIGVLARRFNQMLDRLEASRAALDASVGAQRQLVADASHELRTPITSLRTNIEVLLEGGRLTDAQRSGLLTDVREQTEELGLLVVDLIELARGDPGGAGEEPQDVRLDRLAGEAVQRARRTTSDVRVSLTGEPVVVDGSPERLGRALNNLLDNAVGHSPPGGSVEVAVRADGTVSVRDHGAGVHPDDLPHVFDRFYRGNGARPRQGTGLGLAIVKQAAETHGGTVTAADAPGGGALFTLRLPPRP